MFSFSLDLSHPFLCYHTTTFCFRPASLFLLAVENGACFFLKMYRLCNINMILRGGGAAKNLSKKIPSFLFSFYFYLVFKDEIIKTCFSCEARDSRPIRSRMWFLLFYLTLKRCEINTVSVKGRTPCAFSVHPLACQQQVLIFLSFYFLYRFCHRISDVKLMLCFAQQKIYCSIKALGTQRMV